MKVHFCRKLTRRISGVVFDPHDGILLAFGNFVYQDIQKAHFIKNSRNREKFRVHIMRLTRYMPWLGPINTSIQRLCTKKGRWGEHGVDDIILPMASYQLRARFNKKTASLQKVNEKRNCALSCFTSVTASLKHLATSSTRHSAMGFCWAFIIAANLWSFSALVHRGVLAQSFCAALDWSTHLFTSSWVQAAKNHQRRDSS